MNGGWHCVWKWNFGFDFLQFISMLIWLKCLQFRRDLGSVGYHGHDTDHRNLAADREREMDRRNVSAHERLGRLRNQLGTAALTFKGNSYNYHWNITHTWMEEVKGFQEEWSFFFFFFLLFTIAKKIHQNPSSSYF